MKSFVAVLATLVGATLAACGSPTRDHAHQANEPAGALLAAAPQSPSERASATPEEVSGVARTFTVSVEIGAAEFDAQDTPWHSVVVVARSASTTTRIYEARLAGCRHEDPSAGALATVGCWWAGAGDVVSVERRPEGVVVTHQEQDEGTESPLPVREVARFPLTPEQSVTVERARR